MTVARLYQTVTDQVKPGGMVHTGLGALFIQQIISRGLQTTQMVVVPTLRAKMWSGLQLTSENRTNISTALCFAATYGAKSFSNTAIGVLGTVTVALFVANKYLFNRWLPVPKGLHKAEVKEGGTIKDSLKEYLKPLEKLKPGKIHSVYTVTGMEFPQLVQFIAQSGHFKGKDIYYVDGEGDDVDLPGIREFIDGRATPTVIFSKVPLEIEKCSDKVTGCFLFSDRHYTYGAGEGLLQLDVLDAQKNVCITIAQLVQTHGLSVSSEELAKESGTIGPKEKVLELLRRKNAQPSQLIPLARALGVVYTPPPFVTMSPSLRVHAQGDGKGKGKGCCSTVYSGYEVDKVKEFACDTKNTVFVWNMGKLDAREYNHLLDFLWQFKEETILVAAVDKLPEHLTGLMQLLPPTVALFIRTPLDAQVDPQFRHEKFVPPTPPPNPIPAPTPGGGTAPVTS